MRQQVVSGNALDHLTIRVRRRLLDLLVPGSFEDKFYSFFFFSFFLTHRNLSKQTVGKEVKNENDFLAITKIHT